MKLIDTTKQEKQNKETVFTHYLDTAKGWELCLANNIEKLNDLYNILIIKYLGRCTVDGDMFSVLDKKGNIGIYKGTIGNEFD